MTVVRSSFSPLGLPEPFSRSHNFFFSPEAIFPGLSYSSLFPPSGRCFKAVGCSRLAPWARGAAVVVADEEEIRGFSVDTVELMGCVRLECQETRLL